MDIVDLLARCSLLAPLPLRVLRAVVPRFDVVVLEDGEVAFREGDEGHSLWIVAGGRLQLEAAGRGVQWLTPGAWFGDVGIIEGGPLEVAASAAGQTLLLRLSRTALQALWQEQPGAAAFLHLALANRMIAELRRANERLVELCALPLGELDHEGLRVALQVVDGV